MKLANRHLPLLLATAVARPSYDPAQLRQGIVHIGVGGFHRAHQAAYTDALMNRGEALDWAICGAGLRSDDRAMRDALCAQDTSTLYELGDQPDTEVRVIGAISGMLLAEDDARRCWKSFVEPAIRIVC
ncbi:hypothetical protein P4123_00550 [Pseudomonas aeruginosa]|nr:hypothetical protein [Pseudomonas aeruginosa]